MCRNLVRICRKDWAWVLRNSRKTALASSYSRGLLARSTVEQGSGAGDNGLVPGRDQKEWRDQVRAYLRLHRLHPNSPCPIRGLQASYADTDCRGARSLASKLSVLHLFRP
jgi:hypothetical protein